jgi:hypothetical protein
MIPDFNTFIKESIWSDIHHRSNGSQIRKEDYNNLDRDGLYDYIFDIYEQTSYSPRPVKSQTPGCKYFSIGIFEDTTKIYRLSVDFNDEQISKIYINTNLACCEEFKDILLDRFHVIEDSIRGLIIQDKNGMTTNQLCIDLIQTIIDNTSKPLLKKR